MTWRVAIAGLLAFLLQSAICLVENFGDDAYWGRWLVKLEVQRLAAALQDDDSPLTLADKDIPEHFKGPYGRFYAFRIRSEESKIGGSGSSGNDVLAEYNSGLLKAAVPYLAAVNAPNDWFRQTAADKPFFLAGGARLNIGGRQLLFEVATNGDPAGQRYRALWLDFIDDVWVPLLPTILLMAAFSILGIQRALRPLETASAFADTIMPGTPGDTARKIPLEQMPCEAARFGDAINRLLVRVGELTVAQRQLLRRAAHGLRTPLAIMQLELGNISDVRARRIEADVTAMGELIGRVMFLARLDEGTALERSLVDLPSIVEEAGIALQTMIEERRIQFEHRDMGCGEVRAHAPAIHQAVLELLDNACRHAPARSRVLVTCGPGAQICVDDNGPGLGTLDLTELLLPFNHGSGTSERAGLGLAIVDKAARLHGGRLEMTASPIGGARFKLVLQDAS